MTKNDEIDSLGLFFKDIQKIPLLSADQEVTLFQQMEKGGEEAKEARNVLIRSNIRLIISLSKEYQNRGLSLEDLVQSGVIGLMRAIDTFEYKRGWRLSTFATPWICQSIGRAVSNESRTIRLPVQLGGDVRKMRAISGRLQKELGREPTNVELAIEMGTWPGRVEQLQEVGRSPASLDTPRGEDGDVSLADFIEDEAAPDPETIAILRLLGDNLGEVLDEVLSNLRPRDQEIIRARFGLNGTAQPKTLDAIADEFNLSRERIRQIETKILRRLRNPIRSRKLRSWLK